MKFGILFESLKDRFLRRLFVFKNVLQLMKYSNGRNKWKFFGTKSDEYDCAISLLHVFFCLIAY